MDPGAPSRPGVLRFLGKGALRANAGPSSNSGAPARERRCSHRHSGPQGRGGADPNHGRGVYVSAPTPAGQAAHRPGNAGPSTFCQGVKAEDGVA